MPDPSPPGANANVPADPPPGPRSYALLAEDVRRHYLAYYRMVFDAGVLDLRTKELIAFGVSLATGAPNCVEGHLAKLRKIGVTEREIEEAVAVALGVAGASVVDRADIAQAAYEARRAAGGGK
jgi:AhpD family alkylhydroperoxidase